MARKQDDNGDRALIYVRVSSLAGRDRRAENFHSPEVQVDGTRALLARKDLREVAVVDDDIDISGRAFDRRGIARIRAMVEARAVDIVAVFTLSRVGRNLAESLTFIAWLRKRGVRVISASENFDDTPEGQFQLALWLNFYELQSNQIGAGWQRIIERRARLGRAHGPAAVGYRKTDDGHLKKDPEIAEAVTDMFAAYARGDPIPAITAAFAAARGLPVSRRTVKHMLGNALYNGRVVVESKLAGAVNLPGVHPKLVEDDVWRDVQRRLEEDRKTPARRVTPTYALTGLLACGECEHALFVRRATEHGRKVSRAFCGHADMTRACPGIGRPPYDPLVDAVLDEVVNYAQYLRDRRPPAQRATREGVARRTVAQLERDLEQTRAAMARVTQRWARGAMRDDTYEATMADMAETERQQEAQLRQVVVPDSTPAPTSMLTLVERLIAAWPKMLPAERNRALRAVVKRVVVRRADFWHEPVGDRITAVEFRYPHGYDPTS